MARKKSVTPNPEELEELEQSAGAVDAAMDGGGPMAEGGEASAGDGGAPSEEDMALMESEYRGSMEGVGTSGPDGAEAPPDGEYAAPPGYPFYTESPMEPGPAGDYDALPREFEPSEAAARDDAPLTAGPEDSGGGYSADDLLLLSEDGEPDGGGIPDYGGSAAAEQPAPAPRGRERPSAASAAASRRRERVLTIDARDEIQTEEEREAIAWHEIQNAHRTRRILTGTLDGVEKLGSGLTLAVVNYKGFRVAIPVKEMLLDPESENDKVSYAPEYQELMDRLHRILNARLGSEIDFIVKGCDKSSRSVVGSRREAMYRKRQTFYLDADELGEHLIYEGRVVQARVVAVAEKVVRVEVFGVETSIVARGLSWEWIGNARDHFHVGDRILVRVLKINRPNLKDLSIRADVRSVSAANSHDILKKCTPQCRYAGRVTDVRNGVVFIRLNNGVNAIAHSCYDPRYPGKRDDVSFAVTRLDEEQGVAIGIITRIIKQNL